jgi:hypothetical protein
VDGHDLTLERNADGKWNCPRCEKEFTRADGVSRHLRQACKVTTEEKPPVVVATMSEFCLGLIVANLSDLKETPAPKKNWWSSMSNLVLKLRGKS